MKEEEDNLAAACLKLESMDLLTEENVLEKKKVPAKEKAQSWVNKLPSEWEINPELIGEQPEEVKVLGYFKNIHDVNVVLFHSFQTTLFVAKLPVTAIPSDIHGLFSTYGKVTSVRLKELGMWSKLSGHFVSRYFSKISSVI